VYTEPGQGTVFRVYLPAVSEASQPDGAAAATPSPPAGGTETILFAEDDPAVRTVATEILVRHGYTVIMARNGEEALARADSHGANIQLVVSDVVMPGMDGPTLAKHLRRRHPGLRTLFASGYAGDAIARRGVLESGVPFLEKPFTSASLLRKVREVLDH
jgi:CheY-like chemotaxis protein